MKTTRTCYGIPTAPLRFFDGLPRRRRLCGGCVGVGAKKGRAGAQKKTHKKLNQFLIEEKKRGGDKTHNVPLFL